VVCHHAKFTSSSSYNGWSVVVTSMKNFGSLEFGNFGVLWAPQRSKISKLQTLPWSRGGFDPLESFYWSWHVITLNLVALLKCQPLLNRWLSPP